MTTPEEPVQSSMCMTQRLVSLCMHSHLRPLTFSKDLRPPQLSYQPSFKPPNFHFQLNLVFAPTWHAMFMRKPYYASFC
jgi:hypothetical protein